MFDILVGINLLREGLDIPECALVAILDADKEGKLLHPRTSLIQTIGRAARHLEGRAILYADHMTESLKAALAETGRRREKQQEYNAAHGITPESIRRGIADILDSVYERDHVTVGLSEGEAAHYQGKDLKSVIADLEKRMRRRRRSRILKKPPGCATRSSGSSRPTSGSPSIAATRRGCAPTGRADARKRAAPGSRRAT